MQALNVGAQLETLKSTWTSLHTRKEDLFWAAMMGTGGDASETRKALAQAEIEYNRFLQSPDRLTFLRQLAEHACDEQDSHIIKGWEATFKAHIIEQTEARKLSEEIVALESALAEARQAMKTGFVNPETREFEAASSVRLRLMMRNDPDELRRRAAFDGLLDIERFVLEHGFLDIVKKRNALGRMLGYVDYYDWRTSVVEGMRKQEIFDLLEELAQKTEARTNEALASFRKTHGENALQPWNFQWFRSGDLARKVDPYFPFASALRNWGRSFDRLNIKYRGATLTLDLVERKGKYENGFMHGPEVAFFDSGEWRPARINFTANAVPGTIGGGLRAMTTLFHEGGHAAHFSNILEKAPCFSHEFAPTSVAYAETQSMFLDSLLGDADWRRKYARNLDGEPMPVALIEEAIAENQPLKGWDVRAMLTVPLAESAIYEIPDHELTADRVLETVRAIEQKTQGLQTAGIRPVLAIPHLLAGESSAYYHGYIMAEMAVYQTRDFFLERDGYLTDNPKIGPDMATHYWSSGNSVGFGQTLRNLTGKGLSPDSLAAACNASVEDALEAARTSLANLESRTEVERPVTLDATIRVVHGAEVVASNQDETFESACAAFETWIGELERGARS